jgi:RNA polymerase sigma factor (sigma-70 family)
MNDKTLWDDFRSGQKYALSHIYYQHVQILFRYGKKFTPDDDLVKDTIQDQFIDLIRTRERLGGTDNIKFYLMKSFRRKLFRNISKKKETGKIEDLRIEPLITYSVEEELIGREDLSHKDEMVQEAMKKLSPKMREILYYRYTCEFEYDHICELMGIRYDSARKMVFRAIKELKKSLPDIGLITLFAWFFSGKKKFCK